MAIEGSNVSPSERQAVCLGVGRSYVKEKDVPERVAARSAGAHRTLKWRRVLWLDLSYVPKTYFRCFMYISSGGRR